MMHRAVVLTDDEEVDLCAANDRVHGSIVGFDSGQVIIAVGGLGVRFRNGGTTALDHNTPIVGATRTVTGQTSNKGYVQTPAAIGATYTQAQLVNRDKARGIVIDGGGAHAANTQADADVIVSLSPGA